MDVNDNVPVFSRKIYTVNVAEDVPKYTILFWSQAHDADEDGRIYYSLAGNGGQFAGKKMFIIDPNSGAVRLITPLDYNLKSSYVLYIRARDTGGKRTKCKLMINILPVNHNKFKPEFDFIDQVFKVSEDAPIGHHVAKITAEDLDLSERDSQVVYDVIDGDGIGVFALDKYSGD